MRNSNNQITMQHYPDTILIVADEVPCLLHNPRVENLLGHAKTYVESPKRLSGVLAELRRRGHTFHSAKDFGIEALLTAHPKRYIEWLRTGYDDWVEAGNSEVNSVPYNFGSRGY